MEGDCTSVSSHEPLVATTYRKQAIIMISFEYQDALVLHSQHNVGTLLLRHPFELSRETMLTPVKDVTVGNWRRLDMLAFKLARV